MPGSPWAMATQRLPPATWRNRSAMTWSSADRPTIGTPAMASRPGGNWGGSTLSRGSVALEASNVGLRSMTARSIARNRRPTHRQLRLTRITWHVSHEQTAASVREALTILASTTTTNRRIQQCRRAGRVLPVRIVLRWRRHHHLWTSCPIAKRYHKGRTNVRLGDMPRGAPAPVTRCRGPRGRTREVGLA
jgi:hypothetical protein